MKIVLTERVTDLKWSDCTYSPIESNSFPQSISQSIPTDSYQQSQNIYETNAMQMNVDSSHQSYYAQDAIPQHSRSYIYSQLSTHYHSSQHINSEPYYKDRNGGTKQNFIKTIYYEILSIFVSSSSVNAYSKSQALQPNMAHNQRFMKYELLIYGYIRKTADIPTDIINLFIKYHGKRSKNTTIVRPCYHGFNSVDYRALSTTHYKPKIAPKKKMTMKCVGYNVNISNDIIKSYNYRHPSVITGSDEFNVVFFEKKKKNQKTVKCSAVIFNESIAFKLDLPSCPVPRYVVCRDYVYSSKYGLLLLDQNCIQCFSLKHWKWTLLVTNGLSIRFPTGLKLKNSSYQMIDKDKLFMTLYGNERCMIFDLNDYNVSYTTKARQKMGCKPAICYDGILYKRVYIYTRTGKNKRYCQYYDMTTCKWHDLGNCFKRINHQFHSIWLDDVDKNILYGAAFNAFPRIYMLDLRTEYWTRIYN